MAHSTQIWFHRPKKKKKSLRTTELYVLLYVEQMTYQVISESYLCVPDQEGRALQTCHQHLVRVPGHRVSPYQTQAAQKRVYSQCVINRHIRYSISP